MLSRMEIAQRIPHQGRMCLLERVVEWGHDGIHCEAVSHRDPGNPLRAHGRLGIACGIEYAAQAMAVHGALLGESQGLDPGTPRQGYLASVRNVSLHASRLDDVAGDLTVRADRVMGDANNIIYSFSVAAGAALLLSGRATVVLDASLAAFAGAKGNS